MLVSLNHDSPFPCFSVITETLLVLLLCVDPLWCDYSLWYLNNDYGDRYHQQYTYYAFIALRWTTIWNYPLTCKRGFTTCHCLYSFWYKVKCKMENNDVFHFLYAPLYCCWHRYSGFCCYIECFLCELLTATLICEQSICNFCMNCTVILKNSVKQILVATKFKFRKKVSL